MPIISHFYGILIYIYSIYSEKNEKHHTPHFHAKYAGEMGVYTFDGGRLEGALPRKQEKMVEVWCSLHEDELNAAWAAWNESGETIKIEGLR